MIEISSVTKVFGKLRVLDGISFNVRNSEVVGYVGLNGAGKTTTIRIAVGVLPPTEGDVLIDGLSVTKDKKRASALVGWVPELPIFEQDFRALDYFTYLAGYYGIPRGEARRMGREFLSELGLGDALNKKLAEFSQGMKKRFALAVSMINDPPNFIMDEVLNGLDPQGIAFFRELTMKFRREGKAVLFSSHILSEVEGIADKVVFIHKGRIVGEYSMSEIRSAARPAIEVVLSSRVNEQALDKLRKYGETAQRDERTILLYGDFTDVSEIASSLTSIGFGILEIRRVEKSLEEFFFELIKKAEAGWSEARPSSTRLKAGST